jgi:transcriptional regulator with XRE-family HTH domain
MVSVNKRAAIRRSYRLLRIKADKTQLEVETLARLDSGRYWKIENGVVMPKPEEAEALARVLRVDVSDLPTVSDEARAS